MEQVKGLVLYGSKYGSPRRYAQELARRLGFDCLDHRQATGQEAGQYPVIVYGGGLYAGGVTGLKQTCRRMEQPERAQWFFFTVGLADPAEAKGWQSRSRCLWPGRTGFSTCGGPWITALCRRRTGP